MAISIFDNKIFNGEVFQGYVERIPNPNRTELIRSRAIRPRPDLATAMADQDGGNYITTTMRGLINSTKPLNYDGKTDITAGGTVTFKHSRVVVGRAAAWTENDFSYDITGGQDFIENVAEQISEYWNEIDQATLVHILKGVFAMTDEEGQKFVSAHTTDVTKKANSEGKEGYMDGTTLNTAIQKACGDNKGRFSLAIMHSVVATNLENLKLLAYMKYTDPQGIERDLSIATLNGRIVLVDDTMPTFESETAAEVKGVYTIKIDTQAVETDTITVGGTKYTFGDATDAGKKTLAVGASATEQATALKTVLASQYADLFTVTSATDTVTLTQKIGGTGALPSVSVTGTVKATAKQTTAGVAREVKTAFTTFVLGDGAIEYTDCGAKVPYEVSRDPAKNGGQDTLYSRQRKCFAPFGISFTMKEMATLSPTDEELDNGENWELVNSQGADGKQYIAHKTIPIARIISLG